MNEIDFLRQQVVEKDRQIQHLTDMINKLLADKIQAPVMIPNPIVVPVSPMPFTDPNQYGRPAWWLDGPIATVSNSSVTSLN